jgi:hypothetical protein
MSAQLLSLLVRQSKRLTLDEQLALAAQLIERARQGGPAPQRRQWGEICGLFPYPLAGEDAQTWVTRTRRESEEQREAQLIPTTRF